MTLTTVVIPTVGRPSLGVLLRALEEGTAPMTARVVVVDDRPGAPEPLALDSALPLDVFRSGGRGPAAARNVGWRNAETPWVSFLDDDVVPDADWYGLLADDLAAAAPEDVGSQGRLRVPLPSYRRPTDWERSTARLANAQWITADMSFRRDAVARAGGFDERFRRAYREDADLALRLTEAGGSIIGGRRRVSHPVRPAGEWASVRSQVGNADDQLMRRLHGRRWRERTGTERGRRPRHLVIAASGVLAVTAALTRRRRLAVVAGLAWFAGTAEFAAARMKAGPTEPGELRSMATSSVVIPFTATWHTVRGLVVHRGARPWRGLPELILFDRDGTLVEDVPYNGDPARVDPLPGVREALDRVRSAGVKVGLVTNQSGVERGLITPRDVDAVNARVEDLLGPFDVMEVCPHASSAGCSCRKPKPGMVLAACQALDVIPQRCAVIGDTGADVDAAHEAGADGILVPNRATLGRETAEARRVAGTLPEAVDLLLTGVW